MNHLSRIACVAAACLSVAAARGEGLHGPRISFPVVIDPPAVSGGEGVKTGGIVYQQFLRSAKAIRITADHIVTYQRAGEKSETQIKLPAGTLFVLARDKSGEMYCAANASGWTALLVLLRPLVKTFYDAGVCIRDTDFDGTFDQEIVVDQAPRRTRIAYEILGTGTSDWKAVSLAAEQVEASQIPASDIRITYEHFSGGLFGKPKGVLHFMVCWPKSMVSEEASDDSNKRCANLMADARGKGVGIGAGDGAHSALASRLFAIETDMDKDDRLTVAVKQAPAAGPAQLVMTGRVWQPRYQWVQRTVVDIFPVQPDPASAI